MGAYRRAVAAAATYQRAVTVVRAVIDQKRSLESVWGNESKKLRPPERRRLRELCSGALRHWHRLDAELAPVIAQEAFLEGGKAKRGVDDPELRALMVLALYEGRHMDSSPPLAELRAKAVSACEAMDKPWALGLVGMSVVRALRDGSGDDAPKLSAAARLSLPRWLHAALERDAPSRRVFAEYAPKLLERPDTLVLNVSPEYRSTREEYCAHLEDELDLAAHPCPLAPFGVVVRARPRDVAALPGVAEAARPVFVQDSVQQWGVAQLGAVLQPGGGGGGDSGGDGGSGHDSGGGGDGGGGGARGARGARGTRSERGESGESGGAAAVRVLDACAAPGGKSRALLHHAPHATLTSLDRNAKKVAALRLAVPRASRVCAGDATRPRAWWDGVPYDAVILDVPCSATGILRSRPEAKHQQDAQSLAQLEQTQATLLRALWPLLRPGGTLLYMTCSLLRAENDTPVSTFVRQHGQARRPGSGSAGHLRLKAPSHLRMAALEAPEQSGRRLALPMPPWSPSEAPCKTPMPLPLADHPGA